MGHFNIIIDGRELQVVNVTMIPNEITDELENVVMITEPVEGENFLTGDVLFEAKFADKDKAYSFYELLREAEIVEI